MRLMILHARVFINKKGVQISWFSLVRLRGFLRCRTLVKKTGIASGSLVEVVIVYIGEEPHGLAFAASFCVMREL